MSIKSAMNAHKKMAMPPAMKKPEGLPKYAKGGRIGGDPLKTGIPINPLTQAKRSNGIPGFKKGGKC